MEYNYKIVKSDIANNVMEIEFSAVGYETLMVGMPLPVEGQHHEDIIKSYAPIQYWENSTKVVVDVSVGSSGTLSTVEPTPTGPATSAAPLQTINEQRLVELRAQIQVVLAEMTGSIV